MMSGRLNVGSLQQPEHASLHTGSLQSRLPPTYVQLYNAQWDATQDASISAQTRFAMPGDYYRTPERLMCVMLLNYRRFHGANYRKRSKHTDPTLRGPSYSTNKHRRGQYQERSMFTANDAALTLTATSAAFENFNLFPSFV
jgi:hypothetical protein